jgi:hypothetical protein
MELPRNRDPGTGLKDTASRKVNTVETVVMVFGLQMSFFIGVGKGE